jgi:glutamate racemase
MWVPLVENNEYDSPGADFFIKKDIKILLNKSPSTDTVLLACTHYPLLIHKIENHVPAHIRVISQGRIVAESLQEYLERHPEMEEKCSKKGDLRFFTTDSAKDFDNHSGIFFGEKVHSVHVDW